MKRSLSRSVVRRLKRKFHLLRRVNASVAAMNSFYLGFEESHVQFVDSLDMLPQGQQETLRGSGLQDHLLQVHAALEPFVRSASLAVLMGAICLALAKWCRWS